MKAAKHMPRAGQAQPRLLTKAEFAQQYVLNRAFTSMENGLNAAGSAQRALDAWDVIQKATGHATDPSIR